MIRSKKIEEWKGKPIQLVPAPTDVLTGKKRLIKCQALSAVDRLNHGTSNVGPCKWIEEWITSMEGCVNTIYVPAKMNQPLAEADLMAKFKDGSILVWVGAYEEWGFMYAAGYYSVALENPYVDYLCTQENKNSASLDENIQDPSETEMLCG